MADPKADFEPTARDALLWVLWHHQGGSSKVGQSIRYALGMGQHARLSAEQVEAARRWADIQAVPERTFDRIDHFDQALFEELNLPNVTGKQAGNGIAERTSPDEQALHAAGAAGLLPDPEIAGVRMLTDEEAVQAWKDGASGDNLAEWFTSAAAAIQRKFITVNGLTLKEQKT